MPEQPISQRPTIFCALTEMFSAAAAAAVPDRIVLCRSDWKPRNSALVWRKIKLIDEKNEN